MNSEKKFDTIVIGSGIGGLTTAVLLTKLYGKKVLVLEKHFVPGGQTHEFMRVKDGKKYYWDVGVHYVGEMSKKVMSRKIFDFITDGKLEWKKMPNDFETFVYPDFIFKQPSNPTDFKNRLTDKFPDEEKSINQYFIDIKVAAKWFQSNLMSKIFPDWMNRFTNLVKKDNSGLALMTTKEYMDKNFKDDKLKALLTSIWGDYGVPPSRSAFTIHSIVVRSYLHGGYFPVGGSSAIASCMIPIIEANGGKVFTNFEVKEIIVNNNKAIGIKGIYKKEDVVWYARDIFSDVGAYNTYIKLLSEEIKIKFKNELKSVISDFSTATLYVGLKDSPEKLGVKGENYWISTSFDHDSNYFLSKDLSEIRMAFVSFPSLKNPESKSHTMEITTFAHYDYFAKWKNTHWLRRGEEYKKLKKELAKKLLDFTEIYLPGTKELVDYMELATPLTMEYFTGWEKGSFYGIPATPERFKYKWISPKTPVKNLYLTGSDAVSLGVLGAMMGGVFSIAAMKGFRGFMKLMKHINK